LAIFLLFYGCQAEVADRRKGKMPEDGYLLDSGDHNL
jgi:hypothetical protein